MKKMLPLAFAAIFYGCSNPAKPEFENELLNYELEYTKSWMLAKVNGDPKSTLPTYNKLSSFDDEFGEAILHCETQTDVTGMKTDLEACLSAVNSAGWYDTEFQNSLVTELETVIGNLEHFSMRSLKERLQLIQLLCWKSAIHICERYQFAVDTVGIFVANHEGRIGETFSTPVIGVSYYTAENYSVMVGDSMGPDGQLQGNVRKLKYNSEHMPVYLDTVATPGGHRIPAQMMAMTLSGRMDTMNFNIEYTVK